MKTAKWFAIAGTLIMFFTLVYGVIFDGIYPRKFHVLTLYFYK